jgi:hypothetical protein
MSDLSLTATCARNGIWQGIVTRNGPEGETLPAVAVTHREQPLDDVTLDPVEGQAGQWTLRVPIPARLLSDGVQTFLIRDAATDVQLGSFSIAMGDALEPEIRAEVDLLRAELDMLKRAFRRHCLETA